MRDDMTDMEEQLARLKKSEAVAVARVEEYEANGASRFGSAPEAEIELRKTEKKLTTARNKITSLQARIGQLENELELTREISRHHAHPGSTNSSIVGGHLNLSQVR